MGKLLFLKFLIRSKFNFNKAYTYYKTYDKILKLGLFDKGFYLKKYSHVKESGMDPLEHFLFYGYKEGKYPSPFFNLHTYMEENPDIKINPVVHYVLENSKGHIFTKSPAKIAKERIIHTNSLFLNNYEIKEEPLVSIIVLNKDGSNHLKRLFKNFDEKINYNHYEIIVVDNASSDDSIDVLNGLAKILPITIIKNEKNLSFSKGNNDAAKIAKGEYLLLLNNDIEPTFGWLNEMMGTMLNNDNVGAVGAKLVFPYEYNRKHKVKSFSIQHAGVKFHEANNPYVYSPYHDNMFLKDIFDKKVNESKECISNTAATLLIPKDLYFELGGLDEKYFYGYEDIDFAFKLYTHNYKSIYCPSALLFHHESATRLNDEKSEKINFKNIMYFKRKWDNILFKNFLKDKIQHKHFFTDKKLTFTIFSQNSNDYISNLVKNFCKMKYNYKIISDIENNDLHGETDVFISLSPDYNIKKTVARLNLIKILFLENIPENQEYIDEYDIIITFNNQLKEEMKKNFSKKNIFTVDNPQVELNANNGEEIINILEKVYLHKIHI